MVSDDVTPEARRIGFDDFMCDPDLWSISARIVSEGGQKHHVAQDITGTETVAAAYRELVDACYEIHAGCEVEVVMLRPPIGEDGAPIEVAGAKRTSEEDR